MLIPNALKKGSQDPYVLTIQKQLIKLGYGLPRFGEDGHLGDETLAAIGAFLVAQGLRRPSDTAPSSVAPDDATHLLHAYKAIPAPDGASGILDERNNHPHTGRSTARPYRPWTKITAVVLHQTASALGETPSSWHSVPIHFGVTRGGKIIQLYDLTEICNHANGLNRPSVGIEIDGWYEGIQGDFSTLWQPEGQTTPRKPMVFSSVQADAVKAVVKWVVDVVASNGGAITHIHPHRQASKDRRSDPGSAIWKAVGLWAKKDLGLTDGGPAYKVGSGLTIPSSWDAQYAGNKY